MLNLRTSWGVCTQGDIPAKWCMRKRNRLHWTVGSRDLEGYKFTRRIMESQQNLDPIDSVVIHLVDFYGKCRSIYQSHGSYGDRHAFAGRCFLRQWVLTKNLKTQRTARTSRCLSTREGIYEQHQLMLEGIRHDSLQAH